MKTTAILFTASIALATPAGVRADERPPAAPAPAAPRRAFELTVGTGYTQPFGSLERGIGMPSVATPGQSLEVGVGYRMTERWSLSLSGQFAELTAERSHGARSLGSTISATLHLRPTAHLDPWIDLASGYRRLSETSIDRHHTILTEGLQLVRARIGIDLRDGAVAGGPVIGADASMFFWQAIDGVDRAIAAPRFSTFLFAGVQGRWDLY